MLPRQPCSRSGAWHTGTRPGHGEVGCARFDHRDGQPGMQCLRVDVLLQEVLACASASST